MFITPAFAQSAGGLAEGGFGLLPIVFVMVIFYFLLIRPQQKRAKQHKEMLAAIRRGDKIVTSGGLTGTIVKVVEDSETVEIQIAKDVRVHVVRAMIADVKGKPEPAK
jgi:preprotein translocase subunit YajC